MSAKYQVKLQLHVTLVTIMEASPPWDLWNSIICLNGYSLITSLLRTKKGSPESSISLSLARARGPAVPRGSVSCEHVILMPTFVSNSFRKVIITCRNDNVHKQSKKLQWHDSLSIKLNFSQNDGLIYLWLVIDRQNHFANTNCLKSLYLENKKPKCINLQFYAHKRACVGIWVCKGRTQTKES